MASSANRGSVKPRRDLEVLASPDKKAWVAKASKKSASSEEQGNRRPRAKSDMEEPSLSPTRQGQRTRSWSEVVAKEEKEKGSEIYTRDLLLQLNPSCYSPSTRSTSAASESPGSSPRSLGSVGGLFCAPLEEVQRRNSGDNEASEGRPRAVSESLTPEKGKDSAAVLSDLQTTVVMRGVPAGYTRTAFCERLAKEGFGHDINFLYLPKHEEKEENAGVAYVNLRNYDTSQSFVQKFNQAKVRECLPDFPGELLCEVSASEIQGLERNFETLCIPENFTLWHKQGEPWQPLFLDAIGQRMPLAVSVQNLFNVNRPRSESEPSAAYTSAAAGAMPAAQAAVYYQHMQMQQLQQMQMQMHLQMMQKQLLLQKKVQQRAKSKQLSADSPEFQPKEASLRAEAVEFVPSK